MTSLTSLVPLAELLAAITGSRHGASRLATELIGSGLKAIPHRKDDLHFATRAQLTATGVVTANGVVVQARAAELLMVCGVLAASTVPPAAQPLEPRLVLSAPEGSAPVGDAERLDGLVIDVIRLSTDTLHIGSAFWNDGGFELLNDVVLPALAVRGVRMTIYANAPPQPDRRAVLVQRLSDLAKIGEVTVQWFRGTAPTRLHAKFAIADRRLGYLGTANLTSWGLQEHVEAGVELTRSQAERFVKFLEDLVVAGLFSPTASL